MLLVTRSRRGIVVQPRRSARRTPLAHKEIIDALPPSLLMASVRGNGLKTEWAPDDELTYTPGFGNETMADA